MHVLRADAPPAFKFSNFSHPARLSLDMSKRIPLRRKPKPRRLKPRLSTTISSAEEGYREGQWALLDSSPNDQLMAQSAKRLALRFTTNEIATLVVAIASLFVSYMTYCVASDSSDTKQAVIGLAELARETKRQSDISSQQFAQVRQQTDSLSKAALAASSQAQTVESARKSEFRPYIGIVSNLWIDSGDQFTGIDRLTEAPSGVVTLQNWGKASSLNSSMVAGISYISNKRDNFTNIVKEKIPLPTSISPNTQTTIRVYANKESKDDYSRYLSGDYVAVIAGEIRYTDNYGERHKTEFCYFLRNKDRSKPLACATGNRTN